MISKFFVKKLTNCLKKENIIENHEEQIYSYGLNQAIFIILNIFITLAIAFLLDKKMELLLFIIEFAILRSFSGGYHSKNPVICIFISSLIQIVAVCSLDIIYLSKKELITFTIIISLIIALLSPIETENKPLDSIEKEIYRHKTLVTLIVLNSISILSCFFERIIVIKITLITVFMVLFLQGLCELNEK